MNNEIKISLSIILPGSTMYSKQSCFKNEKEKIIPEMHNKEFLKIEDGKGHFETITINTRKSIPAKQVINLSEEAYNYFISDDKPYNYRGEWKKLTKNARLHFHMEELAKSLGGKMESYKDFD